MKYLVFFKETFNKKSTVNYFFIIFSLFVIIDVSFMFYKYSGKILNDNYKNSYFLLKLNTKNKINLIENYSNIDVYQKCIFNENDIIVEDESSKYFPKSVKQVNKSEFAKYKFDNRYFITLKKWIDYNDFCDLLIKNGIDYDFYIVKKNDLNFENYYHYFIYVLFIICFICLLVFVISIINILIDEKEFCRILYMVGYNYRLINFMTVIKIFVFMLLLVLINLLLQLTLNYFLKFFDYSMMLTNIAILILSIIIAMFWIVGRSIKKKCAFIINIAVNHV